MGQDHRGVGRLEVAFATSFSLFDYLFILLGYSSSCSATLRHARLPLHNARLHFIMLGYLFVILGLDPSIQVRQVLGAISCLTTTSAQPVPLYLPNAKLLKQFSSHLAL